MSEVKQVIVVRKDLNMRKGKIAAQVAHASMKVLLDLMQRDELMYPVGTGITEGIRLSLLVDKGSPTYEWLNGSFTKIVLYVNSEDDITALANRCHFMSVLHAVITDAGRTEFHGEPTITCIAIGPEESDKIDTITGDLPLL
jgi:PTH2 family peptidyl-tRNA hydrolase